ncbi:MAG: hypothetical protein LBC86_04590, partial [Oscillospiraceae bacterium]|nr:hypothetical protein [Oscillospiraceae bacterium]
MKEKLRVLFEGLSFGPEIADKYIISAVHESGKSAVSGGRNSFLLQIESDELLGCDCINKAARLIKDELGVDNVQIYPKYPADLFCAEYITDIIGLMKHIPVVWGGLLDDVEINDDGEVFEITLSGSGREVLLAEGIEKEIEKLVKGFFGVGIKVEFTNSAVEKKGPEEAVPVFISTKPPAPKEADKPKFKNDFNGGGRRKNLEVLAEYEEIELPFEHEMFLKDAKLILGKVINQVPVDMQNVTGEA